jgi:hypothetical protein
VWLSAIRVESERRYTQVGAVQASSTGLTNEGHVGKSAASVARSRGAAQRRQRPPSAAGGGLGVLGLLGGLGVLGRLPGNTGKGRIYTASMAASCVRKYGSMCTPAERPLSQRPSARPHPPAPPVPTSGSGSGSLHLPERVSTPSAHTLHLLDLSQLAQPLGHCRGEGGGGGGAGAVGWQAQLGRAGGGLAPRPR